MRHVEKNSKKRLDIPQRLQIGLAGGKPNPDCAQYPRGLGDAKPLLGEFQFDGLGDGVEQGDAETADLAGTGGLTLAGRRPTATLPSI